MSSKIRVLDEDTINKIAAGEVIENPSSVVKELTENAIDAGATEITIEIKGGGRQLIRITDNGCGMSPDDALLCLERHATSKLKEIEELHSIGTMGFRGEAVPSIASISKFTLFTRVNSPEAKQLGTLIRIEGGKILSCSPVECAPGTTIEVKDLFFNVPVRKKFQRSPAYDISEIQKMVTLLALGNPTIQFQLISNQEILFSAPSNSKETFSASLGERIRQLLGTDYFNQIIPLEGGKGPYRIEGFVGDPLAAKHNRSGQYLFINKRGVTVPLVSFAVRDGYGTMLPSGKHPLFVLHLTMPMDLLDVNVHPQKREVRLRQERLLKELLIFSVEEGLRKKKFIPQSTPAPYFEMPYIEDKIEKSEFDHFSLSPPWLKAPAPSERPYVLPTLPELPPSPSTLKLTPQPLLFPETPVDENKTHNLKAFGTIYKYIIATKSEGFPSDLILVDQRAAHARIIYEDLLETSSKSLELQLLLVPHMLHLTPADSTVLREQLPFLNSAGIQIKEFGPTNFVIDAVPQIFGNIDLHKLIDEIIKNSYEGYDVKTFEKEYREKLALAASRAAIASGARLGLHEAQHLLTQLMRCKNSLKCPQGKTIWIQLTTQDITKLF